MAIANNNIAAKLEQRDKTHHGKDLGIRAPFGDSEQSCSFADLSRAVEGRKVNGKRWG
jgi:hypothetical protein